MRKVPVFSSRIQSPQQLIRIEMAYMNQTKGNNRPGAGAGGAKVVALHVVGSQSHDPGDDD
jgi:hypothetical protein